LAVLNSLGSPHGGNVGKSMKAMELALSREGC
jgi:hypothetical protein